MMRQSNHDIYSISYDIVSHCYNLKRDGEERGDNGFTFVSDPTVDNLPSL